MKIKYLLIFILAAAISSCSSVYRTGQTPDDVYYSPGPEYNGPAVSHKDKDKGYVITQGTEDDGYVNVESEDERNSYNYRNDNLEDLRIRSGINNRMYRNSFALSFGSGFGSYYGMGYNPYYYDPFHISPYMGYSPFNSWNSPYGNYYSPFGNYYSPFGNYYSPFGNYYSPFGAHGFYNPGIYNNYYYGGYMGSPHFNTPYYSNPVRDAGPRITNGSTPRVQHQVVPGIGNQRSGDIQKAPVRRININPTTPDTDVRPTIERRSSAPRATTPSRSTPPTRSTSPSRTLPARTPARTTPTQRRRTPPPAPARTQPSRNVPAPTRQTPVRRFEPPSQNHSSSTGTPRESSSSRHSAPIRKF